MSNMKVVFILPNLGSGGAERVVKDVRRICSELYFAGDETVGVRVIDGEVEVFCRYPVVGSDYSGWSWY